MRFLRKLLIWLVLGLIFLTPSVPALADDGQSAIFGQDFTLKPGERLSHDLAVFGGRVHLERGSIVEGDVAVLGGDAQIEGVVEGSVVVIGGNVELDATAVVEKDLVAFGNVRRHGDAVVKGNTVQGLEAGKRFEELRSMFVRPTLVPQSPAPSRPRPIKPSGVGQAFRNIGTILAVLVVIACLALVLPKHVERTKDAMVGWPAVSVVIGVLTIIVAGLLMVVFALLSIVCIGIPLLIALVIALAGCALLGVAAAGLWIGQKVLASVRITQYKSLIETLVGVGLITIATLVPCIGTLFTLGIVSWGIGGAVLTRLGSIPYAPSPFATPPVAPSSPAPPSRPQITLPHSQVRRRDTRPLDEKALDEGAPPAGNS